MAPTPGRSDAAAMQLPLTAAALLLPALACAQAPAAPDPLALQGAWRIEQARTEPLLDKRHARLEFHADGRLSGHTSCNTLQARYQIDAAHRLTLGPLATSRQRCAPLQMEQEDRVLTALELVATARVRPDGLLELRDADGRGVLRATRLVPD